MPAVRFPEDVLASDWRASKPLREVDALMFSPRPTTARSHDDITTPTSYDGANPYASLASVSYASRNAAVCDWYQLMIFTFCKGKTATSFHSSPYANGRS